MTPVERWGHFLSGLLVGGTGLVYAVMRYALEPAEPWDVVNHPWQPTVQHLHLLVAPTLIFVIGVSWRRHIFPRLNRRDLNRYWSGILTFVGLLPMVFSGYLIQTAVEDFWRDIWVVVHLVSSGLWALGFLKHILRRKPREISPR